MLVLHMRVGLYGICSNLNLKQKFKVQVLSEIVQNMSSLKRTELRLFVGLQKK